MKNLVDLAVAGAAWIMVGWALAFGSGNSVIGWTQWLGFMDDLSDVPVEQVVIQFTFAATATTLVSGSLAERATFTGYATISCVMAGIIYPIAARWAWADEGWLKLMGFQDLAGCSIVHIVGGLCGTIGGWWMGPRLGWIDEKTGNKRKLPRSNPQGVLLGVLFLWMGWYGFNMGSLGGLSGGRDSLAGLVAINTTLGGAVGTIGGMIMAVTVLGYYDLEYIINGALGGLVSVTSGSASFSPGVTIIVSLISAPLSTVGGSLMDRLGVDDPIGVFPVHCLCGAWGIISMGLFAKTAEEIEYDLSGVFQGGGFELMGVQLIGLLAITGWTLVASALTYWIIEKLITIRVTPEVERLGLDVVQFRVVKQDHKDVAQVEQVLGSVRGHVSKAKQNLRRRRHASAPPARDVPTSPTLAASVVNHLASTPTSRLPTVGTVERSSSSKSQLSNTSSPNIDSVENGDQGPSRPSDTLSAVMEGQSESSGRSTPSRSLEIPQLNVVAGSTASLASVFAPNATTSHDPPRAFDGTYLEESLDLPRGPLGGLILDDGEDPARGGSSGDDPSSDTP